MILCNEKLSLIGRELMFTTYIQTVENYSWLDKYHCFGNNYLINSDGSTIVTNQFNGSGVYEGEFVSNRKDLQNKCDNELTKTDLNRIHFDMKGALTNYIVDRRNEKIYIIPDPIGMSIVYYYVTPRFKIYSNSIKEIKKYLEKIGIEIKKNINFFFESLVMNNGGLGHTPYQEVSALKPFNYIVVTKNSIQVVENPEIIDYISNINSPAYEDIISIAKKDIQENMNAVHQYKTDGVKISHLTGGFDSRLILSAILNKGIQDEFIFFCSGKDGTKDKDISKALCKEYDLTFTNYSGYELTKPLTTRIDGFLWSLDYTSGTNYEAHGNYKKNDNVILSGGLGLLYRSVYNLERSPEEYKNYYELMKAKWPTLDIKNNEAVFNQSFVDEFHKNFINYIKEAQRYKVPDDSLFDFIHMRYRSRYFTGQISFFLSSTNPRFDVLYSLKSFLNILFLNQKERKSNIIGLSLLDEFQPDLNKYSYDSNKFNKEFVELKGEPDKLEFKSSNNLKIFDNYNKPTFKVAKKKKNSEDTMERANKLQATLWQVEDEEDAKAGMSSILKKLPDNLKSDSLNMESLNKLINNKINNRIDLRRLHTLYRNFIWFS